MSKPSNAIGYAEASPSYVWRVKQRVVETLRAGARADVCCQQNMSETVDVEMVEVIFREVELEPASEVSDASF